jgi:hypothetical protein
MKHIYPLEAWITRSRWHEAAAMVLLLILFCLGSAIQ